MPTVTNVQAGTTILASKGNDIIGNVNNAVKVNENATMSANLNVVGNLQRHAQNVITNASGGSRAINFMICVTQATYNSMTKNADVIYVISG